MLVSTLSDRSILTGLGTGDSVAQLEEVSSPTKLVIGALRSSISLAECTTREQSADTADLTGDAFFQINEKSDFFLHTTLYVIFQGE